MARAILPGDLEPVLDTVLIQILASLRSSFPAGETDKRGVYQIVGVTQTMGKLGHPTENRPCPALVFQPVLEQALVSSIFV